MLRFLIPLISVFVQVLLTSTSHAAESDESSRVNGIWRTAGYGYIFQVNAPDVSVYEVTAISCLESGLEADLFESDPGQDVLGRFRVRIDGFIDAYMEMHGTGNPDEMEFHRRDTTSIMKANRLEQLPKLCSSPSENSNEYNLQVFLHNFSEHYPFFGIKGTDWMKFSQAVLPRKNMTEREFFDFLVSLVEPLYDTHVVLLPTSLSESFWGEGQLSSKDAYDRIDRIYANIEENYLITPLTKFCQDRLGFSSLPGNIGYLRVSGFTGCSESARFRDDEHGLNQAFDEIFSNSNLEALVIDTRDNGGGSGKHVIQLAQRLASSGYIAFSKQAYINYSDNNAWTEPETVFVVPNNQAGFKGNIALLTSYESISAAETFAMALMKRGPKVVRVGQRTRGVFSNILPRVLPNGWLFGLPNERYLDTTGKSYDEVGIPPDIEINNTDLDIEERRDVVLDAALVQLNNLK